jgi:hypothetical protein
MFPRIIRWHGFPLRMLIPELQSLLRLHSLQRQHSRMELAHHLQKRDWRHIVLRAPRKKLFQRT